MALTEAVEAIRRAVGVCEACEGRTWVPTDAPDQPEPCRACKPYGARVLCASAFPQGARVRHRFTQRTGIVLRSWQRPKDCYAFCDVRYEDGEPGVAWDGDLTAVEPAEYSPHVGDAVRRADGSGWLVIHVSPQMEPPVCIVDDQERANQVWVWPRDLEPAA